MEKTYMSHLQEISEGIAAASQKIMSNYLENKSGYIHDSRDIGLAFTEFGSKMAADPMETKKIQDVYFTFIQSQQELWKRITEKQFDKTKEYKPIIEPAENDKRFNAPEWNEAPYYFDFVKQSYLLVSKMMNDIIENAEINDGTKKKLNFYSNQYINTFSPSNFVATNPEVLKLAQETNGQSLIDGFKNLLTDIEHGGISQTDMSAFKLGENIAVSPGSVIYENELIQLIQYAPTTKTVYETPLLLIPPWINKFYILDLRPENSLVKYLVEKGITTYIISWKNPTPKMGHVKFDDYVMKGCLKAIEIANNVSKSKKLNVLGFCLGGTLLGTALSILATKKSKEENPVNSATFLACMIDFSDIGPMGDVIDNALVKKLERGELTKQGIMPGREMEKAYNLIRANDLIWNFVVNNYLKGKDPTPFDLLYWTNDNTNLPANMYLYYLRQMVLENKLSRKNALRICKTPIDIGKIDIPVYVIGFQKDHISPPQTTFTTTELVSGSVEFILGGSGHVMGVTNAPSKNKYGYYLNGKLNEGFEKWKKTAKFSEGSWWEAWSNRIMEKSGKQIPANKILGNNKYKIIEAAPGRYVKERGEDYVEEDFKSN